MHFFKIAILSSPLNLFTYKSKQNIKTGTKVSLNFRNKITNGAVISSCEKPEFETNEILEVSEFFYSPKQIELSKFISKYYF